MGVYLETYPLFLLLAYVSGQIISVTSCFPGQLTATLFGDLFIFKPLVVRHAVLLPVIRGCCLLPMCVPAKDFCQSEPSRKKKQITCCPLKELSGGREPAESVNGGGRVCGVICAIILSSVKSLFASTIISEQKL